MPSLVTTSKSFLEWAQSLPDVVIPAGLESDMQEAIAEAEAAEQSVQADGALCPDCQEYTVYGGVCHSATCPSCQPRR